jgi:hypothetical protein
MYDILTKASSGDFEDLIAFGNALADNLDRYSYLGYILGGFCTRMIYWSIELDSAVMNGRNRTDAQFVLGRLTRSVISKE